MASLSASSSFTNGTRRIRVGTRGSKLALIQTQEVLDQLKGRYPDVEFEVRTIRTSGDVHADAPLATLGTGVFVKEVERALLHGEVDMAVHSLKDLPTRPSEGLVIAAVCRRLDPRDVLVDRWGAVLGDLPPGARIGTSSPRRAAQLKALRPDVQAPPIRGNVETRLKKAVGDDYDGAVLAAAGIIRLGRGSEVAEYLSPEDFVPAPGQGALAVEVRQEDEEIRAVVAGLEHGDTRLAVTAERAFLETLGGGCIVPVGAYARVDGSTMVMTVFVASPDGARVYKCKVRGRADVPHEVALDARQRLIERGAAAVLKQTAA